MPIAFHSVYMEQTYFPVVMNITKYLRLQTENSSVKSMLQSVLQLPFCPTNSFYIAATLTENNYVKLSTNITVSPSFVELTKLECLK
jgi:hypothetical protein